jgi:hypothetical protein
MARKAKVAKDVKHFPKYEVRQKNRCPMWKTEGFYKILWHVQALL